MYINSTTGMQEKPFDDLIHVSWANQQSPNFPQVEIEERGVKLRLTVVDTPGFGDTIDNANSHQEIIRYIDQQVGKS